MKCRQYLQCKGNIESFDCIYVKGLRCHHIATPKVDMDKPCIRIPIRVYGRKPELKSCVIYKEWWSRNYVE